MGILLKHIGPWIAMFIIGAALWHTLDTPFIHGPGRTINELRSELDDVEGERDAALATVAQRNTELDASEQLRSTEADAAMASLEAAEARCHDRIQRAVDGARAVREIVYERVEVDSNNCPVRDVFEPGQLRDAIGARPGGEPGAGGRTVPAGPQEPGGGGAAPGR